MALLLVAEWLGGGPAARRAQAMRRNHG